MRLKKSFTGFITSGSKLNRPATMKTRLPNAKNKFTPIMKKRGRRTMILHAWKMTIAR